MEWLFGELQSAGSQVRVANVKVGNADIEPRIGIVRRTRQDCAIELARSAKTLERRIRGRLIYDRGLVCTLLELGHTQLLERLCQIPGGVLV